MAEVIGLASGIIALADAAKTLYEMGKEIKASLDMVSANQKRLRELGTELLESLVQMEELVRDRSHNVDARKLREALNSLQTDLQYVLERCKRLHGSGVDGFRAAYALWKSRDDIAEELERLERKINRCYQRFSTGTSARTEITVLQIRDEIHSRLDQVEAGLHQKVADAQLDPAKAQDLVGARDMSRTEMKRVIKRASMELDRTTPSALEKKYLQTIVKTLTDVVSQAPVASALGLSLKDADRPVPVASPSQKKRYLKAVRNVLAGVLLIRTSKTKAKAVSHPSDHPTKSGPIKFSELRFLAHYGQSRDPTEERQDVVLRVLQALRILKGQDSSVSIESTAKELNSLAMSLADLGMYDDALMISMEDIKIYRTCYTKTSNTALPTGTNPDTGKSNGGQSAPKSLAASDVVLPTSPQDQEINGLLADSLRVAAISAYRLGQFDRAISFAEEALNIGRALSLANSQYEPMLANLFNTFSHYLGLNGRYAEAVDLARQALAIRRKLAKENPDVYLPSLSESLLNASLCLGQANMYIEALAAAEEAIAVFQELARVNPDLYEGPLAAAIHGTAKRLIDLGRWSDALALARRDLEMQRELVKKRPEVFSQKLAWAHMLMAYCLGALGQGEEAKTEAEEGLVQISKLVLERPLWATPWLVVAHALRSLACQRLGDDDEAVSSARSAMVVYREFVQSYPRFVHRDLATAFGMIGIFMKRKGHCEEAAEIYEEKAYILRVLGNSGGMAELNDYKVQLVHTLVEAVNCHREEGRVSKAKGCAEEAVALARQQGVSFTVQLTEIEGFVKNVASPASAITLDPGISKNITGSEVQVNILVISPE